MSDELERISCLVQICNYLQPDSKMIEIGCLRGHSTMIFNSTGKFKKIFCIDPWSPGYDPKDVNSDIDFKEVENSFDYNIKNFNNIIKIKNTSKEAFDNWIYNKVDLVYIDGCHTYEAVKEDISLWINKINSGGIIAGHDYGFHENWTEFPGVKQAVDEILGEPDLILEDTSWVKFL